MKANFSVFYKLGGVLSNIFTYLWGGDISLRYYYSEIFPSKLIKAFFQKNFNSITMTTVSTILALVTMPFNLWLYGRNLETESLVIPYKQMSFTLILITIPVLFGMLMNWRLPKLSPYITKVE
jgi:predicted Na+-dependent transporter